MGSGGSKHKTGTSRAPYQPTDRPSIPGKPHLVPGSPRSDPDVITLRWDPPIFHGTSKLMGYLVEHKRTGSPYWVKATPLLVKQNHLSLSGLEPGMRYQFRVTAENVQGRSEPSPFSEPLAISYSRGGVSIAPMFSTGLSDTTATENEKVEFLVKFEGTPPPKISWFKDGFEVFSNRRQRVSTDNDISTLVIHQAAITDEGEIKCSATNKAGHAVTKARLTLEAPPSIRLPRQYEDGLIFELGEIIRLKVSIAGRPQPAVFWYHNGGEIKTSSRLEMATTDKYSVVRILDATREDRGEYTVKAKNVIGDEATSFLVTITDRPLPPGKVQVVMTLGRCVTIAWSMPEDDGGCKIGNFIVEYYRIGWNMWLKAATCRQLTTTIGDLIEGSQYKFRVKAENPYGISDPSPESNVIFIPDPKRGLLEPPKTPQHSIPDDMPAPDEWLYRRNEKQEKPKKLEPWTDDDEHALPSPIILANQVLRKVKHAPKRTWSEDSQGSPPRESPERPPPIPPKRKHRPIPEQERGRRQERSLSPNLSQIKMKVDRRSLSESMRKSGHSAPVNDYDRPAKEETNEEIANGKMRSYSKDAKGQWERELSPNSPKEDETHSSSEMMIVLLPNDREDTDGEDRITVDQLKTPSSIAPPMSLSAPVLGGSDPIEPLLRSAASSSDLLYELTVARLNKEAENEETENNLRLRYGIERKRSFERRGSAAGSRTKDFKVSSDEHLESRSSVKESFPIENPFPAKETTSIENDNEEKPDFSKRFELLEKNFEKYTKRYFFQEKMSEQGSFERSFDCTEDEEDQDAEDEAEDSEPINTRMAKGTFTPMSVKMPVMEFAERLPSPPHEAYYGIPMITISEEPEPEHDRERTPSPPPVRMRTTRSITPTKPSPSPPGTPREPSPNLRIGPKPILKTRDRSAERGDSETEHAQPKKVRIEEPQDRKNIDMYAQKENDIGLFAGEIARNRRKLVKPLPNNDDTDPAKVVVNLYSDIVKEYSQHKKPPTRLYLNYDELKEAADRESHVAPNADIETIEAQTRADEQRVEAEKKSKDDSHSLEPRKDETVVPALPPRIRMRMEYVLDVFLFLVACWLYIFKDPRLAVPLIILMLYRQVDETLHKKLTFLKRFTTRKTTNQ